MQKVCGGNMPFINTAELQEGHLNAHEEAIRCFKRAKKMGGAEYSLEFLVKLDVEITVSLLLNLLVLTRNVYYV
jgi:atlastin